MKFVVQRHRHRKRLKSNHRTIECFPSPTPHHYIIKAYLQHFLLPSMSCLATKKKNYKAYWKAKNIEEKHQALESDLDMTRILELSDWEFKATMISILGEGNGTLLQYSCLENPMDGGAWSAAVHGVAKIQTRLSDFTFTFMHWRRKWQPTPVFLPGESQGLGSLLGCCLWGRTESDTTEAT